VLELLRKVKREGVDDSQYVHTLTYNDLLDEVFCDISTQEHKRLCVIERGLEKVVAERAVAKGVMSKALTPEEYAEYLSSYDYDLSHIESNDISDETLPYVLTDYVECLKFGDKYTRIANLFRNTTKRGTDGKTAYKRYDTKAESCYEDALMILLEVLETDSARNPFPNPKLANEVRSWLDRDVNVEFGYQPDITAVGVPRIRGSKSKYCLMKGAPVVGVRLRKHWRQREALVKSALMLFYTEDALEKQMEQGFAATGERLRAKIARMKAAKEMKGISDGVC
jgi:hypothetical protein